MTKLTITTTITGNGTSTEELYFTYDGSSPMTVTYGDDIFYYVTNLQGDVIAILNDQGTAVVEYTYDAWGNILRIDGSMKGDLGVANPFTYRGYVYDAESKIYYLQSRYYNPEVGRFINADAFASTGQGLLGNNMFAYCNNNPIMYGDFSGMFPWLVAGIAIVCVAIGAIWGACSDTPIGPDIQSQQEEPYNNQPPSETIPQRNDSNACPPYAPVPPPTLWEDATSNNKADIAPQQVGKPASQSSGNTLTPGQRVTNALVGASIGLMVAGAIILTGGAACCIIAGPATTIGFLGMSGIQAVSWGILAYDVVPIFVAPFYGMEMEPLELAP